MLSTRKVLLVVETPLTIEATVSRAGSRASGTLECWRLVMTHTLAAQDHGKCEVRKSGSARRPQNQNYVLRKTKPRLGAKGITSQAEEWVALSQQCVAFLFGGDRQSPPIEYA